MLVWVVGIVVVLALLQLGAFLLQRRDHAFEKSAMALQALATTVALMFAGYWYVYERKGQPQADFALSVVGVHVAKDRVLLEARFRIKNLGATLLEVGTTDARLQEVNADSLPLDALDGLDRRVFPTMSGKSDLYDDGVLMWPTRRWFLGGGLRHIEPGETDLRIVDFVTPCRNTAMRIYFAMRRPGTNQMWMDIATVSLSGVCAGHVGTRAVLSGAEGG